MRLTSADEALLSLLRENARAPTAEIARRLQLSRTTVQSRIERLERLGVIAGYTVRVGDDFEREQVSALIMITVYPKQMPAVVGAAADAGGAQPAVGKRHLGLGGDGGGADDRRHGRAHRPDRSGGRRRADDFLAGAVDEVRALKSIDCRWLDKRQEQERFAP